MIKLFFGGAEVPGWRRALIEQEHVSLSFVGLTRRIKHVENWKIADHFPAGQKVFLDSGAYTLNRTFLDDAEVKMSDDDALTLANRYMAFVADNIEALEMVSEFDALQLGQDWIEGVREDFWDDMPTEKFLPIWHAQTGHDDLERMASAYPRLGVLQMTAEASNTYEPLLVSLPGRYGTKLHGVAMTEKSSMAKLPWDSVGSTSWIAPGQWGETHLWDGRDLMKYPKKSSDQARRRHRTYLRNQGFDAEAIQRAGTPEASKEDRAEVLRLSIWSWAKFVEDINRKRAFNSPAARAPLTAVAEDTTNDEFEVPDNVVAFPPANADIPAQGQGMVPVHRERRMLPILAVNEVPVDPGKPEGEQESRVARGASTNLMQCNACWAREKCPEMQPGASCAFEIPVVVNTTTQLRALRKLMLAIQGQRVLTMHMFEQLDGGYANKDTSVEIGLLNRMMKDDAAAERDHASFEVTIRGDGNSGMISRIFGSDTEQAVNRLGQPINANQAALEMQTWDAEVIDNDEVPGD